MCLETDKSSASNVTSFSTLPPEALKLSPSMKYTAFQLNVTLHLNSVSEDQLLRFQKFVEEMYHSYQEMIGGNSDSRPESVD